MIVDLKEYKGVFCFDMTAETVADAAMLSRMAMNGTQKCTFGASAHKDGAFLGYASIRKRKQTREYIK